MFLFGLFYFPNFRVNRKHEFALFSFEVISFHLRSFAVEIFFIASSIFDLNKIEFDFVEFDNDRWRPVSKWPLVTTSGHTWPTMTMNNQRIWNQCQTMSQVILSQRLFKVSYILKTITILNEFLLQMTFWFADKMLTKHCWRFNILVQPWSIHVYIHDIHLYQL